MVGAGLIWAFFPPPYIDLPGPVWLVLIPAALVAVACAAINVALTLGVEVLIFAARAWHRVPPPHWTDRDRQPVDDRGLPPGGSAAEGRRGLIDDAPVD
jgi:hypothetical protein